MGLKAASQVYQQMPVLPDSSPETQYIRKLGKKLVATIPSQYSWPFEFHVIPQKEINAFALPGGSMFVNVGTITAATNEAELAGVMAHEMSHVYMQHSAKQAGKTQTTSEIAGIAGAILGSTTRGVFRFAGTSRHPVGAQGLMLNIPVATKRRPILWVRLFCTSPVITRRLWLISSRNSRLKVPPARSS
ncbi:MAG: hypothetical protein C5B55_11940 [Blastocatellia bacterium]|nr:MAG: hypothetical protein C5B55_11940 [Blastocatellia bacterium]